MNSSSPPFLFNSFEAALTSCFTGGYEYQKLVDVIIGKNKILQDSIPPINEFDFGAMRTIMAVGLALGEAKKIKVLDFGGGGGYHWLIAKSAFSQDINFDWRIIETELMAKAGSQFLAQEGLQFFSNIKSSLKVGEKLDLVFTSSTIQYCQAPLKALEELVDLGARYLFITRTPFSLSQLLLVSSQRSMLSENGPGPMPKEFQDEAIDYPISYVPKNDAIRIIQRKYDIRFSLKEEPGNLFIGDIPVNNYYGFFCELKKS